MVVMGTMDPAMAFLQALQGVEAYALVLGLLVASGFGLPINEDILLMIAAALTLGGVMEPQTLVAVAWLGIMVADSLIFYWGHRFGARLLQHRFLTRLVSESRLQRMQHIMQRFGPAYIFFVRFLPGLRTGLLLGAGSLHMPYRYLLIFDGVAALIELPVLIYSVRYVGGNWQQILQQTHQFQGVLVPTLVVLATGVWLWSRWRAKRRSATFAPQLPK